MSTATSTAPSTATSTVLSTVPSTVPSTATGARVSATGSTRRGTAGSTRAHRSTRRPPATGLPRGSRATSRTSPAQAVPARTDIPARSDLPAPARPVVRRADAGPSRGRSAGLVLTRRGRLLLRAAVLGVATAAVAVLLVLAWLGAAAAVAPGASAGDGGSGVASGVVASFQAAEPQGSVEVVVRPGDTLWQIARTVAPDSDPRSVVTAIVRANDLSSTAVVAGAVLDVPVD